MRKIAENYKLPYYTLSPTYSICKDHGYTARASITPARCAESKAEVYSRITGYYRPVQNWNDGKTQEFKDRKVYDLSHSHFHAHVQTEADGAVEKTVAENVSEAPVKLLFTTSTCPNCAIAKKALEDAHMEYKVVDAEEHKDLAKKYKIMSAPTLVVIKEDGVEKLTNASNIRKYAEG